MPVLLEELAVELEEAHMDSRSAIVDALLEVVLKKENKLVEWTHQVGLSHEDLLLRDGSQIHLPDAWVGSCHLFQLRLGLTKDGHPHASPEILGRVLFAILPGAKVIPEFRL